MRKYLILALALAAAGCGGNPSVPPKVTWGYGAGNGDPVTWNGQAPVYSRSYGVGADVPVSSGAKPNVSYGYGADNETGVMVQMAPPAPSQQLAAPANPPAQSSPGTHS